MTADAEVTADADVKADVEVAVEAEGPPAEVEASFVQRLTDITEAVGLVLDLDVGQVHVLRRHHDAGGAGLVDQVGKRRFARMAHDRDAVGSPGDGFLELLHHLGRVPVRPDVVNVAAGVLSGQLGAVEHDGGEGATLGPAREEHELLSLATKLCGAGGRSCQRGPQRDGQEPRRNARRHVGLLPAFPTRTFRRATLRPNRSMPAACRLSRPVRLYPHYDMFYSLLAKPVKEVRHSRNRVEGLMCRLVSRRPQVSVAARGDGAVGPSGRRR